VAPRAEVVAATVEVEAEVAAATAAEVEVLPDMEPVASAAAAD